MNHITISSERDFKKILKAPLLCINESSTIEESPDMWFLSCTSKFLQRISEKEINNFFEILLEVRLKELSQNNFKLPLTFYMWFDEQALQLRFNFLKGKDISLPFGCRVKVVHSFESIVHNFFVTATDVLEDKLYLEEVDLTEKDDNSEDGEEYVLAVCVLTLVPCRK